MKVQLSKVAAKEMDDWKKSSPRIIEKIDELIKDILELGFLEGRGKPEQLRHYKNPPRFSRHITQGDRLVYSPIGNNLVIISCKGHYDDK